MPQHVAGLLQHGSRQLEHQTSATRAHGEAEERDPGSVDADKDTEAERLYAAAHKGQVEAGHEAHGSHENMKKSKTRARILPRRQHWGRTR